MNQKDRIILEIRMFRLYCYTLCILDESRTWPCTYTLSGGIYESTDRRYREITSICGLSFNRFRVFLLKRVIITIVSSALTQFINIEENVTLLAFKANSGLSHSLCCSFLNGATRPGCIWKTRYFFCPWKKNATHAGVVRNRLSLLVTF